MRRALPRRKICQRKLCVIHERVNVNAFDTHELLFHFAARECLQGCLHADGLERLERTSCARYKLLHLSHKLFRIEQPDACR